MVNDGYGKEVAYNLLTRKLINSKDYYNFKAKRRGVPVTINKDWHTCWGYLKKSFPGKGWRKPVLIKYNDKSRIYLAVQQNYSYGKLQAKNTRKLFNKEIKQGNIKLVTDTSQVGYYRKFTLTVHALFSRTRTARIGMNIRWTWFASMPKAGFYGKRKLTKPNRRHCKGL